MDIASLGIRIDSSDAKEAADNLEKLPTIGQRVENALKTMGKAAKDFGQGFRDGARQGFEEYRKGAEESADASKKAEKGLKDTTRAARDQQGIMSDLAISVKQLVAGYLGFQAISGTIRSVVQNTINFENEQSQLAAVLRSTGEAAGWNADQLNAMAESLAKSSTFSAGAINTAQTRLLSYTGIVGEQFPEALQAVIDMSARTGISLEQSAETIGRALDVPSQGLTALSRQGFRFTEQQKQVVEQLERAGKVSKAQGIILDALKNAYGGAGAAARDTFGGAVAALRKSLEEMTTAKDGSFDSARNGIQDLTETFESPETKQAFSSVVSGLSTVIGWLVKGTSELINFSTWFAQSFVGEGLGKMINGSDNPIDRIDEQVTELRENIASLQQLLSGPKKSGLPLSAEEVQNINTQLAEQQRRLKDLLGMREVLNRPGGTAPPAGDGIGKPGPTRAPDVSNDKAAKEAINRANQDIFKAKYGDMLASVDDWYAADFKKTEDEAKEKIEAAKEELRQYYEFKKQQQNEEIEQEQVVARARDENAKKMKEAGKEVSMIFTSAFEDAIVQGKELGGVIDGLAQDIMRLTIRQTIVKPVADAVSNVNWGKVFSSFDGGGFTGAGARSGGMDGKGGFVAMLHPNETVIDHTRMSAASGGSQIVVSPTYNISVDSRSDRAQVMQDVDRAVRNGNAELLDQLRRQGRI